MTRARDKRMGRVQQAVDASPVCRHKLQEEYDCFRKFGELPDDERMAYEVVTQALNDGQARRPNIFEPLHRRKRPRDWPLSVRSMLFDEAISDRIVRDLARSVIAAEVAWGGDVESPAFASRHGLPGYGSVSMHVAGWPDKLSLPPYEEQATRLFVQLDCVRGRIPHDRPGWFDAHGEAMRAFYHQATVPEPGLMRDTVLVFAELHMLIAHRKGTDVTKVMELLDAVAHATGEEKEELLDELVALGPKELLA